MTIKVPSQKHLYFTAIFAFLISLVFLYITFKNIRIYNVVYHLKNTNYYWYFLGIMLQFINLLILGLRSRILFDAIHPIGLLIQIRSHLISIIGNMLLTYKGGDLFRSYYLSKNMGKPFTMCLAVVSVEKLYDLFMLILLFLTVLSLPILSFQYFRFSFEVVIGVYALVVLVLVFIILYPSCFFDIVSVMTKPLPQKIVLFIKDKVQHAVTAIRIISSTRILLMALSVSLVRICVMVCINYCWLAAFNLNLPWYSSMVLLLFISFSMLIPAGPGYIGTYDYFTKTALVTLGVNASIATVFALVTHFMAMVPIILIGLPFVLSEIFKKPLLVKNDANKSRAE